MTVPSTDTLRAKTTRILCLLREEYGSPESTRGGHPDGHPTDSLIATILSQHTADRNSHAAYRHLKERYTTWQEIAEADTDELASVIRVAGLANIKALRIQQALAALQQQYGTMDLDFLRTLPVDEGLEILQRLPGVGPKTAACVLLFSCDLPALPVDTHVHRVAARLGLIGPRTSAEQAHREIRRLVAPEDSYDFHVDMIRHGRKVCIARNPRCGECILQHACDYFSSSVATNIEVNG